MCGLCCALVAIPATFVLPLVVAAFTFEVPGQEVGSDCFQSAKEEILDSRTSSRGESSGERNHN